MNKAHAIACLETGAEEHAVLTVNKPNHRGADTHELMQVWLDKTIGAGLDTEAALEFLAARPATALEEEPQVTGYSVAEPLNSILKAWAPCRHTSSCRHE